ncbi:MAG TPA: ABC-type transport auxiliary lipoprotein family protein [Candidatus Eisenbacteria bacterium]|nr:ABC-type transport auxiliary lipoprotein family protein [Candidatus Eisenbacteria bacterium]
MRPPVLTLCWVALVALAPGCVSISLERDRLERRYFVLDPALEPQGAASNGAGVLKIADVRVSPRYDGKGFTYRAADLSYETDYYNQFLIPPGPMLTDEVQQALAQAHIFRYVVNSESQLEATHRLESTVGALYGDFSDKSAPRAVLEMTFLLSRENPERSEVVFQESYRRSVPVEKRTPEALVGGWNRALAEILSSLVKDLRAARPQSEARVTPPAARGTSTSDAAGSR